MQPATGRVFVIALTAIACIVALGTEEGIFEIETYFPAARARWGEAPRG